MSAAAALTVRAAISVLREYLAGRAVDPSRMVWAIGVVIDALGERDGTGKEAA